MEETIVSIIEMLFNSNGIAGLILSILIGLLTLVISVASWVLVVWAIVWYVRSHKKKPEKKMTDFSKYAVTEKTARLFAEDSITDTLPKKPEKKVTDFSKYAVTEKAARLFAEDFITDTLQGFKNFENVRAPEYYCCRRIRVAKDVVYRTIPGEGVGQVTYARFEDEGFSNLPDDGHKSEMCKALETKILEYVKNDPRMLNYRIESKFTAFNECRFEAYRKNPRYVRLVDWDAENDQQIKENEQKATRINLKQKQQEEVQSQEENEKQWVERLSKNERIQNAADIALREMIKSLSAAEKSANKRQEKITLTALVRITSTEATLQMPHGTIVVFSCEKDNFAPLPSSDAVYSFGFWFHNSVLNSWEHVDEFLESQKEGDELDGNITRAEDRIVLTYTLTRLNPSYEPPKEW